MNVYQQDDSLKKLNYYSRFSPKKKMRRHYLGSPLINYFTNKKENNKMMHSFRYHSPSKKSVARRLQFTLKPINNNRENSFFNLVNIGNSSDNFILIDDGEVGEKCDEPNVGRYQQENVSLFLPKSEMVTSQQCMQGQQSDLKGLCEHGSSELQKSSRQIGNILIQQDDEVEQIQEEGNEMFPQMNRYYTFGNPLNQKKIGEYPRQQQQQMHKKQVQSNLFQQNINVPPLQRYKQMPLQLQLQSIQDNHENINHLKQPILIEGLETNQYQNSSLDVQIPFCSSPKFNITPFMSEQNDCFNSDQKNEQLEQNHKQNSPIRQLFHSVKRAKPFDVSLKMIQQLLDFLPQNLYTTYYGMYRKLSVDQREIQGKLEKQQKKIKILKCLKQLKKMGVQCQSYLLQECSQRQDTKILLNQIIIRAIIKNLQLKR